MPRKNRYPEKKMKMKMKTNTKISSGTLHATSRYDDKLPEVSLARIQERFEQGIQRRYWAEKALQQLLPRLAEKSVSYELSSAVAAHLEITDQQVDRLLHVFDLLGERAMGARYEIMESLLENAEKTLDDQTGYERDSGIIKICKRIMLHEIAIYEKLLTYSKALGKEGVSGYLTKGIAEEKAAHELFSAIALHSIYFDETG